MPGWPRSLPWGILHATAVAAVWGGPRPRCAVTLPGCAPVGLLAGWDGHFQPHFHAHFVFLEQQLSLSPREAAGTVTRAWGREPPALGFAGPHWGQDSAGTFPAPGRGMNGSKTGWKWEFPLLLKVPAFPGNLNWERSIFHAVGKFFTGTKEAAEPRCLSQVHPIPTSPPHRSATISPCQLHIRALEVGGEEKKSHLMQTKVV